MPNTIKGHVMVRTIDNYSRIDLFNVHQKHIGSLSMPADEMSKMFRGEEVNTKGLGSVSSPPSIDTPLIPVDITIKSESNSFSYKGVFEGIAHLSFEIDFPVALRAFAKDLVETNIKIEPII